MAKFFAQLFLSAMVALGAAAGFSPHVKDKMTETLSEAKALAHEATRSALETIARADLSSTVSLSASTEAGGSASADADARAGTEGNAVLDLDGLFVGATSADGSLSTESQTDVGVEGSGIGFNLTNALHSALGFGLEFGE